MVDYKDKYEGKTREKWWTDRFPKKPIIYKAQGKGLRDVRNFIFDRSYLFTKIIRKYNLNALHDDDKVYNCCMFVQDKIKYVEDVKARGYGEFWQYPEDTLFRASGDCEDMAILMKSLTMALEVPDWKVKIIAGKVKDGGHAYCTYIRDDDTQAIMDCCYWPNRLKIKDRPSFDIENNYGEIWFSFNRKYSYAEKRILITGKS